jgi:hypothetical protein
LNICGTGVQSSLYANPHAYDDDLSREIDEITNDTSLFDVDLEDVEQFIPQVDEESDESTMDKPLAQMNISLPGSWVPYLSRLPKEVISDPTKENVRTKLQYGEDILEKIRSIGEKIKERRNPTHIYDPNDNSFTVAINNLIDTISTPQTRNRINLPTLTAAQKKEIECVLNFQKKPALQLTEENIKTLTSDQINECIREAMHQEVRNLLPADKTLDTWNKNMEAIESGAKHMREETPFSKLTIPVYLYPTDILMGAACVAIIYNAIRFKKAKKISVADYITESLITDIDILLPLLDKTIQELDEHADGSDNNRKAQKILDNFMQKMPDYFSLKRCFGFSFAFLKPIAIYLGAKKMLERGQEMIFENKSSWSFSSFINAFSVKEENNKKVVSVPEISCTTFFALPAMWVMSLANSELIMGHYYFLIKNFRDAYYYQSQWKLYIRKNVRAVHQNLREYYNNASEENQKKLHALIQNNLT